MSSDRDFSTVSDLPYFFLSYARIPKLDPNDATDPDEWVRRLYDDLCRDILNLTSAQPGSAGFMDRETRVGTQWPDRLAQALASCRVFVPLYSPRYFQSEHCGREWFAFARRMVNQRARDPRPADAIVPALWVAVNSEMMPDVARSIQFDHQDFGPRYRHEGFYGIMKLGRYREDYKRAVLALARRIVAVAEESRIDPERPADYMSLESAFSADHLAERARRQVRITVIAPDTATLPNGRSNAYYGPTSRAWSPYHPEYQLPLADYATALVTSCLGCHSAISTVEEQAANPGSNGASAAPGLFLIDAWATRSPRHRTSLRRVNMLEQPWISVMVPWNRRDAELTAYERDLKQALSRYLANKLDTVPGQCRMAATGIPTLPEFGDLLPKMTMIMLRRFLRDAPAYPPPGPHHERPRLSPPDPEDPGGSR